MLLQLELKALLQYSVCDETEWSMWYAAVFVVESSKQYICQ
jgi:hypothetical protein